MPAHARKRLRLTSEPIRSAAGRLREALRCFEALAFAACEEAGLEPRPARVLGQLVVLGASAGSGPPIVFSPYWGALSLEEFAKVRLGYLEARQAPVDLPEPLSTEPLTDSGVSEHVALLAEAKAASRILSVGERDGQAMVLEGRFSGVPLDTLVHRAARISAQRSYQLDPRSGRTLVRPGLVLEPHVTVAQKGRLMVELPAGAGPFTQVRRAMRRASRAVPSIEYVRGSRNALFYFEPKDFEVVRDALSGMALSEQALGMIQGYYAALARADEALSAPDRASLGLRALGGFKPALKVHGQARAVELNPAQLGGLAWLQARGWRGVLALDTGLGKTLLALAIMRKMRRDGVAGHRRFLYVVPPALKGHLAMEASRFLLPKVAAQLLAKVDVLSYRELLRAPIEPSRYAACFFDEAQALARPRSKTARAVLALCHPRKILLSASPMEKSPMEAYALYCAAENIDLNHRTKGREHRLRMRRFKARFLETIAGRPVGVTPDPVAQRDLRAWIKLHIFYADKTTAGAGQLGALSQRSEPISMSPKLERAYRACARRLGRAMEAMIAMFRDRARHKASRDRRIAQAMGLGLAELIGRLNTLANAPERLIKGAGYPKLDRAAELLKDRLFKSEGQCRAVLFSDDRELILEAAKRLSLAVPGKVCAAALSDRVVLFRSGERLERYGEHRLPFRARPYADRAPSAWRSYVVGELLPQDSQVFSLCLQGTYSTGYNLQAFDTVIHLDRDTWCAEQMRQRTARVWRQGQERPVFEYTLDMVYQAPRSDLDGTLDEVRRYHQASQAQLFDQTIRAAQKEALGEVWTRMPKLELEAARLDRQAMEIVLSPQAYRVRPSGERP